MCVHSLLLPVPQWHFLAIQHAVLQRSAISHFHTRQTYVTLHCTTSVCSWNVFLLALDINGVSTWALYVVLLTVLVLVVSDWGVPAPLVGQTNLVTVRQVVLCSCLAVALARFNFNVAHAVAELVLVLWVAVGCCCGLLLWVLQQWILG